MRKARLIVVLVQAALLAEFLARAGVRSWTDGH